MSKPPTGPRCDGFSLIEVLVAFTILAMSLGTLYQIFGTGLRAADLGGDYSRAVLHARSQLARLGVDEVVDVGTVSGDFGDGYRWRAAIEDYIPGEGELPFSEGGLKPLMIRLQVIWENGARERVVELSTLRLKVPT